jgi:cytochrome c oxidase cbb3-type subunit III
LTLAAVFSLLLAAVPFQLAAQTGQQLFESTCAGCHGLDGKGGEHAPNIASNAQLQAIPDARLAHIIRNGIPASGMPAFSSVFKTVQIDAVVSYLRTLQKAPRTAIVSGDREAGRTLFFGKAQCAECHTMDGKGGFFASDLSGYANAHSADELRQQMADHNEVRRRQWTRIVTRNGKEYLGLVRNEDNFSLQLQTTDGDFLFWRKTDLAVIAHKDPASLTAKDLNNLIAYLARTSETRSSATAAAPKTPPK